MLFAASDPLAPPHVGQVAQSLIKLVGDDSENESDSDDDYDEGHFSSTLHTLILEENIPGTPPRAEPFLDVTWPLERQQELI